jgi:homoserine/homoserine lactone efflux protein
VGRSQLERIQDAEKNVLHHWLFHSGVSLKTKGKDGHVLSVAGYCVFTNLNAFIVSTYGGGYGMKGTFGGILGISFGALVMAAISATSLGVVLAASALAFTIVKFIGAAYLVYLGIKLWRAPAFKLKEQPAIEASFGRRFIEGMSLQLTNPKAIFFFLSIFPQFIDRSMDYSTQFTVQVLTYSSLVVVIHSLYALFAQSARLWLASESRRSQTPGRSAGQRKRLIARKMANQGDSRKADRDQKDAEFQKPGDFDRRALLIWDHVARNWSTRQVTTISMGFHQ